MANECAQIVNCASEYLDFHFLLPFIFLLKNICTGKMSPIMTRIFWKKNSLISSNFRCTRETETEKKLSHLAKLQFLNDIIYSYRKEAIWNLAIWQNWCFGHFFIVISLVWWKFKENERISFFRKSGPKS